MLVCVLTLTACGCEHEWKEADCYTPKTCTLCSEIEGVKLEHVWQDATCELPVHCANCDTTEGEALGHLWEDATCTTPKTCAVCSATEGAALYHQWSHATITTPQTCKLCGKTEGSPLPIHSDGIFSMSISSFVEKYNANLRNPRWFGTSSFVSLMSNRGSMLDDSAPEYTEEYFLLGTDMLVTFHKDPKTKGITRIVFSIEEESADEFYRNVNTDTLDKYISYGLTAYTTIKGSTNINRAISDFNATEDQWENGYNYRAFTRDGVTFKLKTGYHFLEMEICIEAE